MNKHIQGMSAYATPRAAASAGVKTGRIACVSVCLVALATGLARGQSADTAATNTQTAQHIPSQDAENLGSVLITARNRVESAQEVPVPVSVLGAVQLEQANKVTTADFSKTLPNLIVVTSNPRQNSIAIRGVGKNSSDESREASVGFIIDDVYLTHPGSSAGDFLDLERVEVARGPQGTLLGKNTTLGVVNIVSHAPAFTPAESLELAYGTNDFKQVKASFTGPLIDDKLAYRAAFGLTLADGQYRNTYNSDTLNDRNRFAGKLQFLGKPVEGFTARLILDYSKTKERTALNPYNIADPLTYTDGVVRATTQTIRLARSWFTEKGGWQPTFGDWDHYTANANLPQNVRREGVSLRLDKKFGEWNFASISAYSAFVFEPFNDYDPYDIFTTGGSSASHQRSQEFRLTSPVRGHVDFQAGLYFLDNQGRTYPIPGNPAYGVDGGAFYATNAQYKTLNVNAAGRSLLAASLNGVKANAETHPSAVSYASYAQANWHLTKQLGLTTGLRFTSENRKNDTQTTLTSSGQDLDVLGASVGASSAQITAAKGIRTTQILSSLQAQELFVSSRNNSFSWLVTPNYRITKDTLVYATGSYGEKSPQVTFFNSSPVVTKPERVHNAELGLKTVFFNGRILLNVDLYNTDVKDYQTNLRVPNPLSDIGEYTTVTGNIPGLRSRGFEGESTVRLGGGFDVQLSGAINDARYTSFHYGPLAGEEEATLSYQYKDYTGRQVAGASRYSFSAGLSYRANLGSRHVFHANIAESYRSRSNLAQTLSIYGWQDSISIVDAGFGIGTKDGTYDVSLIGKNIGDTKYLQSFSDLSSSGVARGAVGDRRAIYLAFRANY